MLTTYKTYETYAMACPSDVAVPRPSSSNATSELFVADDCIKHKIGTLVV